MKITLSTQQEYLVPDVAQWNNNSNIFIANGEFKSEYISQFRDRSPRLNNETIAFNQNDQETTDINVVTTLRNALITNAGVGNENTSIQNRLLYLVNIGSNAGRIPLTVPVILAQEQTIDEQSKGTSKIDLEQLKLVESSQVNNHITLQEDQTYLLTASLPICYQFSSCLRTPPSLGYLSLTLSVGQDTEGGAGNVALESIEIDLTPTEENKGQLVAFLNKFGDKFNVTESTEAEKKLIAFARSLNEEQLAYYAIFTDAERKQYEELSHNRDSLITSVHSKKISALDALLDTLVPALKKNVIAACLLLPEARRQTFLSLTPQQYGLYFSLDETNTKKIPGQSEPANWRDEYLQMVEAKKDMANAKTLQYLNGHEFMQWCTLYKTDPDQGDKYFHCAQEALEAGVTRRGLNFINDYYEKAKDIESVDKRKDCLVFNRLLDVKASGFENEDLFKSERVQAYSKYLENKKTFKDLGFVHFVKYLEISDKVDQTIALVENTLKEKRTDAYDKETFNAAALNYKRAMLDLSLVELSKKPDNTTHNEDDEVVNQRATAKTKMQTIENIFCKTVFPDRWTYPIVREIFDNFATWLMKKLPGRDHETYQAKYGVETPFFKTKSEKAYRKSEASINVRQEISSRILGL